jgi:formylglycine-generating enzyme required for sulfatase activity
MSGNVCELVSGVWSARYGEPPSTNPNTVYHVCRGGSLNNRDNTSLEATFRRHGYHGSSTDNLSGVRCAANAPAAP